MLFMFDKEESQRDNLTKQGGLCSRWSANFKMWNVTEFTGFTFVYFNKAINKVFNMYNSSPNRYDQNNKASVRLYMWTHTQKLLS